MALSAPTSKAAAVTSVSGGTSVTTASFTPTANALLVVLVWQGGVEATFSISDTLGGLSWHQVTGDVSGTDEAAIFYAVAPGTPIAGTITVTSDTSGETLTAEPFEVTGNLTTGPVGATGGSSGGSDTTTLSATPASGSLVVALVGQYTSSPSVWGDPSGYTSLIAYTGVSSFSHWQAAYLNGGASQNVVWTGGNVSRTAGVAIEILAVAPPVTALTGSSARARSTSAGLAEAVPLTGSGARSHGGSGSVAIDIRLAGTSDRVRVASGSLTVTVPTAMPVGLGFEINGRSRDATAVLTVTVAPVVPGRYLPTLVETYDAPVVIDGQPFADADKNPWLPIETTRGFWGAFDIVIAGRNVNTFRTDNEGNPILTIVARLTDKDPGGDDECDLIFRGITSLDTIGSGDLLFLRPDEQVTVRKLAPDGVTVTDMFEGAVGPRDDAVQPPSGQGLASFQTVHCYGMWTALDRFITLPRPSIDQYMRPIPAGHMTPVDPGQFIYAHIRRAHIYGWPGTMPRPAPTGMTPTGEQGVYGEAMASVTIQNALAAMQLGGVQKTIVNVRPRTLMIADRVWDEAHSDFSLRCGQRGVTHLLTIDPMQAYNAIYGHGQAPYGDPLDTTGRPAAVADWMNWMYPFAIDTIPPFPLSVGAHFSPGGGTAGFQPFSDELRSHQYALVSQDTYLAADQALIEQFQTASGISETGNVGGQTWNQAFQTGINTKVLAQAYIKALVVSTNEEPFLVNARGGSLGSNPDFRPHDHPRREFLEQFGALAKHDAVLSAMEEWKRKRLAIYRGTITAENMDPPQMPALDTRSGMTMTFENHAGADRRLFVAKVERVPGMDAAATRKVTWTVSEQPDGMMTLGQQLTRKHGIKDLVSSIRPPRHHSKNIPSWPIFDAESGAGIFKPGQVQEAGKWNKYLIPMGAQVDVSAVKIIATVPTLMSAAMFADPYLTVARLVALSGLDDPSAGGAGGEDPWAANQDQLAAMGWCWGTGGPGAMQGYWPNVPAIDAGITGVLVDQAPWPFRANAQWGALFVWTADACSVHGDPSNKYRAIFPNPVL